MPWRSTATARSIALREPDPGVEPAHHLGQGHLAHAGSLGEQGHPPFDVRVGADVEQGLLQADPRERTEGLGEAPVPVLPELPAWAVTQSSPGGHPHGDGVRRVDEPREVQRRVAAQRGRPTAEEHAGPPSLLLRGRCGVKQVDLGRDAGDRALCQHPAQRRPAQVGKRLVVAHDAALRGGEAHQSGWDVDAAKHARDSRRSLSRGS